MIGGTIDPDKFQHLRVVVTIKDVTPAGTIDPLGYSTYTDAAGMFNIGPIWVYSAVFNMDITIEGCRMPSF